ncbi:MAG: AtpZ/AtpI family protein [Egibacteraceae bacterium]
MTPANGQPAESRAVAAGDDTPQARTRGDHPVADNLDAVVVMGVELVVALVLWTLVGRVADTLLETGPWLTVLGALFGWTVGLAMLRRRASESPVPAERQETGGSIEAASGGHHAG